MAFQFMCPQGHLLEGEQSQGGQQCRCPQCGMIFIIPMPAPAAVQEVVLPEESEPAPFAAFGGAHRKPSPFLGLDDAAEAPPPTPAFNKTQDEPAEPVPLKGVKRAPEDSQFVHIPCPNGHELETPIEMLGQEVMCPVCDARFHLRAEKSVEHRRRRQEESDRIHRKQAKAWMNAAVGLGVIVLVIVVVMIVVAMQ